MNSLLRICGSKTIALESGLNKMGNMKIPMGIEQIIIEKILMGIGKYICIYLRIPNDLSQIKLMTLPL